MAMIFQHRYQVSHFLADAKVGKAVVCLSRWHIIISKSDELRSEAPILIPHKCRADMSGELSKRSVKNVLWFAPGPLINDALPPVKV